MTAREHRVSPSLSGDSHKHCGPPWLCLATRLHRGCGGPSCTSSSFHLRLSSFALLGFQKSGLFRFSAPVSWLVYFLPLPQLGLSLVGPASSEFGPLLTAAGFSSHRASSGPGPGSILPQVPAGLHGMPPLELCSLMAVETSMCPSVLESLLGVTVTEVRETRPCVLGFWHLLSTFTFFLWSFLSLPRQFCFSNRRCGVSASRPSVP